MSQIMHCLLTQNLHKNLSKIIRLTFKCAKRFDELYSRDWIKLARPIRWHVIQLALMTLFSKRAWTSKNPCSNSDGTRGACCNSKSQSFCVSAKSVFKIRRRDNKRYKIRVHIHRLELVLAVVALHSFWQPNIAHTLSYVFAEIVEDSFETLLISRKGQKCHISSIFTFICRW